MFTLNRVSAIGLGLGLVLVGCASPTDETADDAAEQGQESAEAVTPQATDVSADQTQAPDQQDEGTVDSKGDKIIIGPYGGAWGGGWGVPVGGFWGAPGLGWGGGIYRGAGWGWGGAWGTPGLGWGNSFFW
jgi:hypothetical protein